MSGRVLAQEIMQVLLVHAATLRRAHLMGLQTKDCGSGSYRRTCARSIPFGRALVLKAFDCT
jgi:hypothetical protein